MPRIATEVLEIMETSEASWLDVLFEQSQEHRRGLCASTEAFFPIWLKRLRREQSFTQQALADALDVAYSTVQLWERRHQPGDSRGWPNPHHLNQLRALSRRMTLERDLGDLFQDQRYAIYRTPLVELIRAALEAGLDTQAEAAAAYLADTRESVDMGHSFAGAYQAHFSAIVFAVTRGQASAAAHRYCRLAETRFVEAAARVDGRVLEQHRPLLRAIQNEELGCRCERLYAMGSPERIQGAREIIDRLLGLYKVDGKQNTIYLQNAFETACAHLGRDDMEHSGVMLLEAIGTDRFTRFFNSLKEISNRRGLLKTILDHSVVKTHQEIQHAHVLS
ncbi:helix-turn-helix transcriptional regulator [uncultured Thiocystis sp.]|uniref:helix-turn-helix transcriptional regulator n=1 Tax=uncultured Thiocystis sp. TaxID=1202134 RepID=UPI0025FBAAC9|nr:helix-turn-helix transcriptional regulator [uncultured Thiocystis sp.]